MIKKLDVSVIIVNWNTCRLLQECIESIYRLESKLAIEIIVVDNNSSDGSADNLKTYFSEVKLIENSYNAGFAKASNQGASASSGKYIMFLNSDTIVHEGAFESMAELLMSKTDAGICACKLLNTDGSLQPNVGNLPTYRAMMERYTILKYLGLFKRDRNSYKMRNFKYDRIEKVGRVVGAAFMMPRGVFEQLGGLDEKFFFYFEETDLCKRVRDIGYEVYFTPKGQITHFGGRSSNYLPNAKINMMFFTSMFHYFKKHKGSIQTAIWGLFFKFLTILYYFSKLLEGITRFIFYSVLLRRREAIIERLSIEKYSLFFSKFLLKFIIL